MPVEVQPVVIVGAGPAGLAAATELGRAGVTATVLERSAAIAASWRRRYDRLRLNTSRYTSRLAGAPYPKEHGAYPSRDQFIDYLERYVAQSPNVRLNTAVERIDRADGGWQLTTSDGGIRARQVIVATGLEHTPIIPDWEGRATFAGLIVHSADYRNAEPFRDKDVLVVGPGCSGMEIAYDLSEGGARSVRLAVRTPPSIVLREADFPFDLPGVLLNKLPVSFADALTRKLGETAFADLAQHGLPLPEQGLFSRIRRESRAPTVVDKEVLDAIRNGTIKVVPALASLTTRTAIFADGQEVDVDAIVAATGYRRGLEPLVGHLDVLDSRGLPRHGVATLPGLRFIGFVAGPGMLGTIGREARKTARRVARELQIERAD